MATATKQLEAIYQEMQEKFAENPAISVTPLDGDPPEKYEITYNIAGFCKDESGEIEQQNSHTITISIPFGFPHFPPSCKPKSPIFHPDFDPAAICIGEFWEKDRSISELVEHIAQMISGVSYSTANAFNEEAAQWYQKNASRLPLEKPGAAALSEAAPPAPEKSDEVIDDISLEPMPEADEELILELDEETLKAEELDVTFDRSDEDSPVEMPAIEDSADLGDGEIDTLDESFLETDFDYLDSEQSAEDDTAEVDTDRFKLMARQKRYFELDMELGSLDGSESFAEQENLASQAAQALQQAREIYNQGTDFEHQGNPSRALAAFQQVEEICSDYPGLQEDIERTKQAKELLGDWAEPDIQGDADLPEGEEESGEELEHPPPRTRRLLRLEGGQQDLF